METGMRKKGSGISYQALFKLQKYLQKVFGLIFHCPMIFDAVIQIKFGFFQK